MANYLQPAGYGAQAGGRRHGATLKTLKRALKKAGLKTTGKKATLTKRAKKAHLKVRGGAAPCTMADGTEGMKSGPNGACEPLPAAPPQPDEEMKGGRRRRGSRRSRGFKLF